MKKNISYLLLTCLAATFFFSCSEDSPAEKSSQTELLSLKFDNEHVKDVEITDTMIWISLSDELTREQLATMTFVPQMEIAANATVVPASGSSLLLNKKFDFTVTAQDGVNVKKYPVGIRRYASYTFDEDWVLYNNEMTPENGFFTPANRWWDTSNTGIFFIRMFMPSVPMVVEAVEEGMKLTRSAKIQTADTQGMDMGFVKVPKVTSGTLFNGKFETDIANTLNSTKFGTLLNNTLPVELKLTYKYTAGEMFYRCPDAANAHVVVEEATTADEYSIVAVLYEVETEKDVLTGVDLNTSDKVVLRAEKFGTTKDWTTEALPFKKVKEYDPAKMHKLAIVLSSSRWGDQFSGAPGSALIVEQIDLVTLRSEDNTAE